MLVFFRVLTAWLPWINLILLIVLLWMVSMLSNRLATVNGPRTRQELEDAFTAGRIGRDEYDRLKVRLRS